MRTLFSGYYKNILFLIFLSLSIVNTAYCQTAKNNGSEASVGPFMTPVMAAAYQGDSNRLRSFIENGADVNAADPAGTTLLMFAAMSPSDNAETVSLLLKHGARYDKVDANGTSALTIAKNRSKIESAAAIESFYRADLVNTLLLAAYLLVILISLRLEKKEEEEKEPEIAPKSLKDHYYTGESFEKLSGRMKAGKEKFQH